MNKVKPGDVVRWRGTAHYEVVHVEGSFVRIRAADGSVHGMADSEVTPVARNTLPVACGHGLKVPGCMECEP